MVSGFLLIISLGHFYCAIFVLYITSSMYKEIISLKRKKEKDEKIIFSYIDWYYFGVVTFFILPKLFLRRILVEEALVLKERTEEGESNLIIMILYNYHNIISFNLSLPSS
jgi:CDP-diglyceride synthetase